MKEEVSWAPFGRNCLIKTLINKSNFLQEEFYHPINTVQAPAADITEWKAFVSPSVFAAPAVFAESAWAEHTPFASWLIEATNPGVLVELGTHAGLSYFTFCKAVADRQLNTKCFAIDTWEGDKHAGFYDEAVFAQVQQQNLPFSRFSTLYRTTFDEALHYFDNNSIDILHIDGLHTYEAVKHDFYTWLPKLSEKGIVLFHDIHVKDRGFGVYRFWDEVKQQFPYFEFTHGYGLGIAGTGKSIPASAEALFAAKDRHLATAVRRIYKRLGFLAKMEQEFERLEKKYPGIHANNDHPQYSGPQTGSTTAEQAAAHRSKPVFVEPMKQINVQAYWQNPATTFNEHDSIIQTLALESGVTRSTFSITSTSAPVTKLRIDPGSAPGIFYLHELSVGQTGDIPLLQLPLLPAQSTFHNLAIVKSTLAQDVFLMIAVTNDPIIELDLGTDLTQLPGKNLELQIAISGMDNDTLHKELNGLAAQVLTPKTINDLFAHTESAGATNPESENPVIVSTHQFDSGK
jgi:Methyltransferase domain